MPYGEYLRTEEWQKCRLGALERAGKRCQLCGSGERLDVHHNTYVRRGCELESDVIALCRGCHARHHGQLAARVLRPRVRKKAVVKRVKKKR